MNTNNDSRVLVNYIERELQPLRERIAQLEAQVAKLQPAEPKRLPWAGLLERKAAQ
ncbi:hypothetical protein [Melaminivora suipulveris]|uniref:hypothetical protein n=1 Tax=Melaminivora suipulveris TaxID=2109913 RepID=UPI00131A4C17|nr:hypothetical protein [Melaminivora suipulveris]